MGRNCGPLGDVRIYVGCRDDRLHCLQLSGVRYGVKLDDGKPKDEVDDGDEYVPVALFGEFP